MNLDSQSRRRAQVHPKGKGHLEEKYPHVLQFYSTPPDENISLQEFEELALERLKVLKAVENVGLKHVKGTEAYNDMMENEIKKTKMKDLLKRQDSDVYEIRRKDHISHFILLLAYCRTEELRRWFIQQEIDLFRFRFLKEALAKFDNTKADVIKEFLVLNNLHYLPIPDEEKTAIFQDLLDSSYEGSSVKHQNWDYYKVDFTEALDLVRYQRVFLKDGYAYVAMPDLVSIILTVYRTKLSHALAVTSRHVPNLEEDNRLLPLLNNLSKRYLGDNYNAKKRSVGQITASEINELSKVSFPPCMSGLQTHIQKEHHLRHGGRQQYGLFLKGIGLSLEEALKFWKTEFTKGPIDGDKFDKNYSYNIRHNYGKEGKRADYTPYSCLKIIMSNQPGQGDAHGCPFKHSDPDLLRQKMQAMNISRSGIDDVMKKVKDNHYQLACGLYFKHRHNVDNPPAIQHPNQYYEESREILSGEKEVQPPNKEPRVVKLVPSQSQAMTVSQLTQNSTMTVEEEFESVPMSQEDFDIAEANME